MVESVMRTDDAGGEGGAAKPAAAIAAVAPAKDAPNLGGFNRMLVGAEAVVADVEGDARELVHEAMRKLGALHVALDKLGASASAEILVARQKIGEAIVSVARHLAG